MKLECAIQKSDSVNLYIKVRSGTEIRAGFMEIALKDYFMVAFVVCIGINVSHIAV